jgi:hypothetical protein
MAKLLEVPMWLLDVASREDFTHGVSCFLTDQIMGFKEDIL